MNPHDLTQWGNNTKKILDQVTKLAEMNRSAMTPEQQAELDKLKQNSSSVFEDFAKATEALSKIDLSK